jgi:hypothetical protein
MPLNPRRVRAIPSDATDYHDPIDRAAFLERVCSADLELRRRVEALLRVHDELNSVRDEPSSGDTNPPHRNPLLSDYFWRLRRRS